MAEVFKERLTEPSTSNLNWIKTTYGGYNYCILGNPSYGKGSVLSNCCGWAWGRWRELLGKYHKLSRGNAENWYGHDDGYARGQTPKLGAVICWRKGKAGDSSDGAGHVAIVEQINDDESIVISESHYNGKAFDTKTLKKPYVYGKNYILQGFIYSPIEFVKNDPKDELKIGDYVQIKGAGNSQADGKGRTATSRAYKRYILKIHQGAEYPYQIGNKSGSTTGFYKASALKKL